MALIGSTLLDGFLSSAKATGKKVKNLFGKEIPEMMSTFVSGFGGTGWKIWNSGTKEEPQFTAEFDNIRVRGTISVHELVIQKIRAVCGALGISQACGKVESVSEDDDAFHIKLEGESVSGYGGFREGDLIRCQRWTSSGIKGYWVEVDSVSDDGSTLVVKKSEFKDVIFDENSINGAEQVQTVSCSDVSISSEGVVLGSDGAEISLGGEGETADLMVYPSSGDEIVQYGSTKYENRRTAIYIHAMEDSQPAMDILFGIKEKTFYGCLKVRLGGGLPDSGGVGLYCEEGHILAKKGADILYEFKPDGYFNIGKGKLIYDPVKDTLTLGEKVIIQWTPPTIESATEYASGISATIPPARGWDTVIPSVNDGYYLWSRTKLRYSDGSSQDSYIYSVSKIGADGTSVKVSSTKTTYAVTDTAVRPSDSKFTATMPSVTQGQWMWSRTEIVFSDGKFNVSYAASYSGTDGKAGLGIGMNLMDYTNFNFKEDMYDGTKLNFETDSALVLNGAVIDDNGIGGSRCLSGHGNSETYTDLCSVFLTMKKNALYAISFYAKGDTDFSTYLYPDTVDISVGSYVDGELKDAAVDGMNKFEKSNGWRRHFYVFQTKSDITGVKTFTIRIPKNGGTLSVCLIKIAESARSYIHPNSATYLTDVSVRELAKNGINSIYLYQMPEGGIVYTDMFHESIASKIAGGGDYTLSFLVRGVGKLCTYVYGEGKSSPLDSNSKSIADGIMEQSFVSDGLHEWNLTDDWEKHVYTFRTATQIEEAIVLFRVFRGNGWCELSQVKLEAGVDATEWIESSSDRFVMLPDWVDDWNGHSTIINGERVIAPQGFFGEKVDGKLTGVLMGLRTLNLDGVGKNGIYALDKNKVMVAIDPTNARYQFRGRLIADEGQFNGMVFGSYYKSNVVVTEDNFVKLFEERTHYEGGETILVPVWSRIAQVMIFNKVPDSTGNDVEIHLPPYYYGNSAIPTGEDYAMALSMLGSTFIWINRTSGSDASNITLHGKFKQSGNEANRIEEEKVLGFERCLYMTCKITSGGLIYFEWSGFSESSAAPKFDGNIIPLRPNDWRGSWDSNLQ